LLMPRIADFDFKRNTSPVVKEREQGWMCFRSPEI
jgi:hypothetical protein